MQWAKAKRMWCLYYRGGGVHYISTPMRMWQVFLVLGRGAGLLAGLIRPPRPGPGRGPDRDRCTRPLIHTIVVSQARYNVPLMPTLIAAGVAGWFLALRAARQEPEPATLPEWTSDRSESGTAAVRAAAQRS